MAHHRKVNIVRVSLGQAFYVGGQPDLKEVLQQVDLDLEVNREIFQSHSDLIKALKPTSSPYTPLEGSASREPEYRFGLVPPLVPAVAAREAADGEGVLGVPGVRADRPVVSRRRPEPRPGPEPVLGGAGGGGRRQARRRAERREAGAGSGGGPERGLGALDGADGAAALAVAAVAGAAAVGGGGGGRRVGVERRDGLPLLVELRGLDLLLGTTGQVHLHTDTLLLPPAIRNSVENKH